MIRPEPNLDGYREAQLTLIAKLGDDVPFFTPVAETYPPGTVLDPETERPFDPTIAPQASGFASASVRCGVVTVDITPSRRGVVDQTVQEAIGTLEEGEAVLIVPTVDYEANNLDAATQVDLRGDRWEITQATPDGIGNVAHRQLVFVRQL